MYDFLIDELIINDFLKKEFLNNLALNHVNTLHRKNKITDEEKKHLIKVIINPYTKDNQNTAKTELIRNAMKDGGIDTRGIYQTFNFLNLNGQITDDLYFKIKSFLDIFSIFDGSYTYLKD